MLGLLLVQQPGLLPSRRASAGRGHDRRVAMTIADAEFEQALKRLCDFAAAMPGRESKRA